MNVPPPREIPKLREQTRRYTATQKEQSDERRRRRLEAYLKAEEAARMRAIRAERATTITQEEWTVVYQRPPYARTAATNTR